MMMCSSRCSSASESPVWPGAGIVSWSASIAARSREREAGHVVGGRAAERDDLLDQMAGVDELGLGEPPQQIAEPEVLEAGEGSGGSRVGDGRAQLQRECHAEPFEGEIDVERILVHGRACYPDARAATRVAAPPISPPGLYTSV